MSKTVFLFLSVFVLCGCGAKEHNIIYKDVLIPVKCQVKMPLKPRNDGTFEAHKKLMIYYLECENALKFCLGLKND